MLEQVTTIRGKSPNSPKKFIPFSEKSRAPAYTDRILWKSNEDIQQLTYMSHDSLISSDHKPVSSIIRIKVNNRPDKPN